VLNLGKILKEWREHFSLKPIAELAISITWEQAIEGLAIPCDPLVLRDAVSALLDNSRDAALKWSPQRLSVQLHASVKSTKGRGIPQVVELMYHQEGGAGISGDDRGYVIIDGFTTAEASRDKGRGLALISRQLLEYHGHLELVNNNPVEFLIRLGIPESFSRTFQGELHAKAVSTV
jgi:nitrogen fixation/metabolism regulation signal transduction histidine kinase